MKSIVFGRWLVQEFDIPEFCRWLLIRLALHGDVKYVSFGRYLPIGRLWIPSIQFVKVRYRREIGRHLKFLSIRLD